MENQSERSNQPFKLKRADQLYYLASSDRHPSDTHFHFSFADYYDPNNMNFGLLRVLNDDTIKPHNGFAKHPHKDMQIVSYIIEGQLTHWDNMTDCEQTIGRGHVQAISAGSGVWHSEQNRQEVGCRLLQIWLTPPFAGGEVSYTNHYFAPHTRENQLQHIVGNPNNQNSVPLSVNSDSNIYVSELTDHQAKVSFTLAAGRQAYINCIEGQLAISSPDLDTRYPSLNERDSLGVFQPLHAQDRTLHLSSETGYGHVIIIEMAQA